MFYKVHSDKASNTFKIDTEKKMYGNRRAIGFLRDLKRTVNKRDLKLGQEAQLKNIISEIQTKASGKHPWLYKLQAKLNPWSKAYKIEHLSQDILIDLKAKSKVVKSGIKQNNNEPFSFFSVPKETLDALKVLKENPSNKLKRTIYYCPPEYFEKEKFIFDIHSLMENRGSTVAFEIEFDPTYSYVKVNDSFLDKPLYTVNGSAYTSYSQPKKYQDIADTLQEFLQKDQ